jgi:nicotinate-nucleotide adenylyltransferase
MKIGILGGTFNPPHIGHLILAEEIREKLNLDKIFFIPTNIPPHKEINDIASLHRLNMVKLSVEDNPYFEVLDLEIKRGGISFTIDTLKELKKKFPQDVFFLIVGSDLAQTFSAWKDFEEIKKLARIVVAQRKEYILEEKENFILVEITQIDISSSQIRDKIEEGRSIKYLVKEEVEEYIENHQLYKKKKGGK